MSVFYSASSLRTETW